jgi:undecaprenyl phosphate-alpha-L-ara4FN deformylase
MIPVGLRIDVDTLRGTRVGVPNLVRLMARHRIRASFFFSVGPDNMGRHLWRLIRPRFLMKMLRTRASRLYGWDILLRGTLWPGPVIGDRCTAQIREVLGHGHETGLHAWDHHGWQHRLEHLDRHALAKEIKRGYDLLTDILNRPPDAFAAPAWRVTPEALYALDGFSFRYQSDCRGHSIFRPVVDGRFLGPRQVPVTLPTYDELVGRQCTPEACQEILLNAIQPDRLNVLTIHAEVEGISELPLFERFLDQADRRGMAFCPLGELLPADNTAPGCGLVRMETAGREGWISGQQSASAH